MNEAQQAAMDRAGELPMERQVAERREAVVAAQGCDAKIEEIRQLLGEAYRFHSTSPRAQSNINAALDLLDEIAKPVAAALPASNEQPTVTADFPIIALGKGLIEVGQGNQGGAPAILFGRNGAGAVGVETEGDRVMVEGECLAAITFGNPESLDVVAEKLAELRARCWPAATPALPAEKVRGLTDAQVKLLRAAMAFAKEHIEGDALHDDENSADDAVEASDERYNETKRLLCDAYLELLAASGGVPAPALPAIPEGWKLVPIEPTDEMRSACHTLNYADEIDAEWEAMLSAVPELPEGNQQPQTDSGLAIRPSAEPAGQHDAGSAALINDLKFALQDCLGFAELIEAMSKPDVEIYKHELRGDSELAQKRINIALQSIEDWTAEQSNISGAAAGGNTIPGEVRKALDRMCMPLHESRLDGCTAKEDARCMAIIKDYIEFVAAPSHAASTEPVGVVEVHNEGGSGEFRIIAPIGKPNYDLAEHLPVGTKLYTHPASTEPVSNFTATQAAQPTERLTDAQIDEISLKEFGLLPTGSDMKFARAIESALAIQGGEDARDAERLEFMISEQAAAKKFKQGYCLEYIDSEDQWQDGFFATPRAAIDAAILASQS